MTTNTIYILTRDILNTNPTVLPDSKLLEWLNIRYGHRILDILRYQVDRNATMQISKTNFVSTFGLVAGDNGYDGEYAFPTNMLRPIRMEVSYDGVTFNKCKIYDIGEFDWSEVTGILENCSKSEPVVRFERDSFFIRPLNTGDTVIYGIRIWYEKRQTALTAGDIPDFEENLHDLLAFDLAEMEMMRHAEKYTDVVAARVKRGKEEREERFIEFYNNRMKRNFQLKPRYENFR